ncbi:MAG TPA: 8-amino-7-oxononanoate synthase [Gemmataceae bacterium]|jgi:8-amino-7-oxononanoate synthase|nr:8-amino-7-oxononanoate synthase [Gemmataceae bacterium]
MKDETIQQRPDSSLIPHPSSLSLDDDSFLVPHPSSFSSELAAIRDQGLYRVRRRLQSAQGPRIRWKGREFLNFSSNDYLNLAADPRLARAAVRAARRYGVGAGASPLISGLLPPLRRLERELAAWEETETALVFSSGFAANLGVIGALAGPDDAILSDAYNHASLIDGCRLSKAPVHVYRHADVHHLDELLKRERPSARRRLIVTDSVFSMDGDGAPLREIMELAREHDALVVLDEAHATGVLGEKGRGLAEMLLGKDVFSDRLIRIGTLSKALGSQGGFVCGSRPLIELLVNRCRPYIYSTALAPPCAAAARRAVALVQAEPNRRQHLLCLAAVLRARLQDLGFAGNRSQCHIVPVIVGEATEAMELSARLADRGLLVPAIRPPSVPEGTSRLRISLTAGHTEEDIERLVLELKRSRY